MKKFLLSLLVPLGCLPVYAQDEVSSNPLEFTADGITYTILDVAQKTCQTKAGYSYIDYEQRKILFSYGNNTTGDITIPATVQNPDNSEVYTVVAIGNYGFDKVSSVTISSGITQIGEYAFMDDESLTSVTIPETVTSIGRNAFFNCIALTDITLPSGITSIEPYVFSYSGLNSITIPQSVISIGENAFATCSSLQSVTIPGSVLTLGKYVFSGCTALNSLTIEEGISSIPAYAFSGCSALTTLNIPASVNSIGDYGFNCAGLTSITCQSHAIPTISANSFNSAAYTNATLYVYKTVVSNYENSQLWGQFSTIEPIEMPAKSITITPSTLNVNVGLTSQLTANLEPADATGEIVWALVSANPANCIDIDETGFVTARQIGTARVSASSDGQISTCDVIVTANPNEAVVITPPAEDIYIGDSLTLSAIVFPTTITPNLTWSSSNPGVATIDSKTGKLTAVADGATVITATNDNVSGTIALTVKPIEATSVTLDQEAITLKVGGTQALNVTILPENTTYKNVTWDSNDPSVAIVADGVVTAVGTGTANIRAMVGNVTANCTVTVDPVLAENVTLSTSSETMQPGQSLQLTATVSPDNTTDKTITWVSTNQEVASVSVNGLVTAFGVGETVITATCGDVSASCEITVEPILSEGIVLNYTAASVKLNNTLQLYATIYPAETTDKTVVWTSDDPSVASVENGLVSALTLGSTVITATNGTHSASCLITVDPIMAEQVILVPSNITVQVGGISIVTASVLPFDTTDPTVTWASLQNDIASVSDGMVTGKSPGTTVITATCGDASASCNVTVLQACTSITLNETSLELKVGELYDLIETVMPENTTDVVSWTSSNPAVATVDENGIVSAIKAGTTTVTATCGSRTATCEVTVTEVAAVLVDLNFTELELKVGQSQQIEATVLPSNTTNPTVTWTSSDNNVAVVSEDGTITAKSAGTVTITATCGNVSGTCIVTVTQPEPEEVVLSYSAVTLKATESVQLAITNPSGVDAADVTWTSSNTNVVTVSSTGLVTAVKVGEATVTASYNGEEATCIITVAPTEAELVELDYAQVILEVEETFQLTATVSPSTTTYPEIIWSSSNPAVAEVSENGLVTALSTGSATITAVCGNVYASCSVTVVLDKSTFVEEIQETTEADFYRVYNLQGINLMNTKDKSDLSKLQGGLYIINGKKYVIRK